MCFKNTETESMDVDEKVRLVHLLVYALGKELGISAERMRELEISALGRLDQIEAGEDDGST